MKKLRVYKGGLLILVLAIIIILQGGIISSFAGLVEPYPIYRYQMTFCPPRAGCLYEARCALEVINGECSFFPCTSFDCGNLD